MKAMYVCIYKCYMYEEGKPARGAVNLYRRGCFWRVSRCEVVIAVIDDDDDIHASRDSYDTRGLILVRETLEYRLST